MIDFHKELKKFKPCLEVDKISDSQINTDEIDDIIDILKSMSNKKTKGED